LRLKTITLDTNCINTKQGMIAVNKLERWHKEGLVEIVKTDVMDTELGDNVASFRQKALKKSQEYHEDIGDGVWGHSRWGHFCWRDESTGNLINEIKNLLFPEYDKLSDDAKRRALRDSMHLAAHKTYNRDVFVTEDKHFLNKRDILRERFGIMVLSPEQIAEQCLE